jgi:hypothetical protein
MSYRVSDVKSKLYSGPPGGGSGAGDRIQLEELPTPICWLRGVQYVLPTSDVSAGIPGFRFDLVTEDGSGTVNQEDILISFPSPYFFGTQNFFFPADSYFEIVDSSLYVTSANAHALDNFSLTVYYT